MKNGTEIIGEDEGLYLQWIDDRSDFRVIIEECNYTVWAYLCLSHKIIADVWLYNTKIAPDYIPWKRDKYNNAPYMNPQSYIWNLQKIPIIPNNQLGVLFTITPDRQFQAEITMKSEYDDSDLILLAVLREDEKVGWCHNAQYDNRCAKSLVEAIKNNMYVNGDGCCLESLNDTKKSIT